MNFQFTKLVKANERIREFNFTKPSIIAANLLHVDVSDDKGNRIMFMMQKEDDNHWKIIQQELPKWVYEVEAKLNNAIEEEHQQM